jgi:hypothetical protein
MPPFLAALIAAGIILLIPRKNQVPGSPVVVPSTPSNTPPGITTSFAQPPIQRSIGSGSAAPPLVANAPGTSGSGVPQWSANAQEFNTNPYMNSPAPSTRIPGFYAGPIEDQLRPRWKSVKVPAGKTSCSGGCGGSCGGGCTNTSDCGIAKQRNLDGGCLAPTQEAQLRSAPPGVLASWAANLASAGANGWNTAQQAQFDRQDTNPAGDDQSVPASPNLTGIGISTRAPLRSAIFSNGN